MGGNNSSPDARDYDFKSPCWINSSVLNLCYGIADVVGAPYHSTYHRLNQLLKTAADRLRKCGAGVAHSAGRRGAFRPQGPPPGDQLLGRAWASSISEPSIP